MSSWEATSRSATQEFPNILWNPKIHHCAHKRPPLDPVLIQVNPVHTTPSYKQKQTPGLSPPANYIDRATAACRRS
jgi:hypothetical protein